LKVGASKSATSASCETLAVIVKDGQLKNVLLKNMTKTEIAEAFSNGEFEKTNNFISDNAEWIVIEEDRFIGKQAILDNCEQVGNYFKSITTNFKTLNIITEGNKVVINGTAEFLKDNKRVSFVSSCDVYEFNEKSEIQKITSYCIQPK
jgi:ABC-type taurine transport system substrate-binding protein